MRGTMDSSSFLYMLCSARMILLSLFHDFFGAVFLLSFSAFASITLLRDDCAAPHHNAFFLSVSLSSFLSSVRKTSCHREWSASAAHGGSSTPPVAAQGVTRYVVSPCSRVPLAQWLEQWSYEP